MDTNSSSALQCKNHKQNIIRLCISKPYSGKWASTSNLVESSFLQGFSSSCERLFVFKQKKKKSFGSWNQQPKVKMLPGWLFIFSSLFVVVLPHDSRCTFGQSWSTWGARAQLRVFDNQQGLESISHVVARQFWWRSQHHQLACLPVACGGREKCFYKIPTLPSTSTSELFFSFSLILLD